MNKNNFLSDSPQTFCYTVRKLANVSVYRGQDWVVVLSQVGCFKILLVDLKQAELASFLFHAIPGELLLHGFAYYDPCSLQSNTTIQFWLTTLFLSPLLCSNLNVSRLLVPPIGEGTDLVPMWRQGCWSIGDKKGWFSFSEGAENGQFFSNALSW